MRDARPSFISYSANGEDVLINRVFAQQANGCFVDVGAAHPTYENDTKALYDRGWTGINIEPNSAFFDDLASARPKDRNLNIAISEVAGRITFYEVVGTGLSTCDRETAQQAAERGFKIVEHEVIADTLSSIFATTRTSDIDLLKVDVEGFELKVLSSNDWSRYRPKLIIVEATFPETPTRRPDTVGPFLAVHGYRKIYFDGLNDYFVEQGFDLSAEAFASPPNIFDRYVRFAHLGVALERDSLGRQQEAVSRERDALMRQRDDTMRQCEQLQRQNEVLDDERRQADARVATLSAELGKREQALLAAQADVQRANAATIAMRDRADALARDLDTVSEVEHREIQAFLASTSWRVTRPLRALRTMLNGRTR